MSSNHRSYAGKLDKHMPLLKLVDCSVRLSVIPLCILSIWFTVTNQQESSIYGKIKSTNLMGLKYMVSISAVCAGYAFVAIVALWIRFLVNKAWLFFVSDQIMAYLVLTSGAAAMEIVYLAYKGDKDVTWSEACSSYGRFCSRMKLALILQALIFCCFFILALISAYRAFSLFDHPLVDQPNDETS